MFRLFYWVCFILYTYFSTFYNFTPTIIINSVDNNFQPIYDHNRNMGMVSKKHTQPNPTKAHPSHQPIERGSRTKRLRVEAKVYILLGKTWDDYQ